ncbi:MAG: hypothetical protein ACK2TX_09270, partial [Anaerolineales bacterium]
MQDSDGQEPNSLLSLSDATISPEILAKAGEVLSKSTLFAVRREYLDAPVFEQGYRKFVSVCA